MHALAVDAERRELQRMLKDLTPGDVVVTMGAGDVTMLGPEIIAALHAKANRSHPGTGG